MDVSFFFSSIVQLLTLLLGMIVMRVKCKYSVIAYLSYPKLRYYNSMYNWIIIIIIIITIIVRLTITDSNEDNY